MGEVVGPQGVHPAWGAGPRAFWRAPSVARRNVREADAGNAHAALFVLAGVEHVRGEPCARGIPILVVGDLDAREIDTQPYRRAAISGASLLFALWIGLGRRAARVRSEEVGHQAARPKSQKSE